MNKYSVLIIDDHPLITDVYKSSFLKIESTDKTLKFDIVMAFDCDSALEFIQAFKKNKKLKMVVLDISIPPSKIGNILSGEDLGLEIRKMDPEVKIIVSTAFNDSFRINNILKSIDPEDFLIKSDIDSNKLTRVIKSVINCPPYYSSTVLTVIRNQVSNEFVLDKIDRQLLFELSNGAKTKELMSVLFLSVAGIERRKRKLKEMFGVKKKSDRELVRVAKDKGFI